MTDWLVESDVIVDFLEGADGARDALEALSVDGLIRLSAVSAVEVLSAAAAKRKDITLELLDSFGVVPVDREVAVLAGEYDVHDDGYEPDLGDRLVAATARRVGAVLVTRGHRRYPPGQVIKVIAY